MLSKPPILVVDDAPVSLKMTRLLLTHEGYDVRTAESAEDALQMLSEYRPELILADIKLPGMNGLDMTRQIKQDPRTSDIRVVALTACAMQEDREKALEAGCDDYISKPISASGLSSKVRELLVQSPAAQAATAGQAAPLPDYLVQATAGKSVALIGFSSDWADAMCAMLERGKARPRLFNADDDPLSDAIRGCDLVLFHVRPQNAASSWLQPGATPPVTRLVFTGDQRDLIGLPPEVRSRALDVFAERDEPEEVLMRLALAASRSVAPPPAPATAATPVPVRPRSAVANPTVLLADDDEIVRALIAPTIRNHGMTCRSTDNGRDALHLIRSEQPHVAILDVSMPGIDGYEVLATVRSEQLPTRVILLTAYQREKDVLHAFNLGADDYLTKPFNPFELVARVRRLLQ